MKNSLPAWLCAAAILMFTPAVRAESLTLDEAIQRAISYSPKLKSADHWRLASEGDLSQAGVIPNPILAIEAENIGGSGVYRGLESAEVTYGVSQQIETGGKRSARTRIAKEMSNLAGYDVQAARLDLIRDVTVHYAQAIAADEQVKIAREQKALAAEVLDTVGKRVSAAADPVYLRSKAEIADAAGTIALAKSERESKLARQRLSAFWGEQDVAELDPGAFFSVMEAVVGDADLSGNPDLKRYDAEQGRTAAAYELERANAIPDPSLTMGVRDLRGSGDQAFVVGVSVPIPVFNGNDGNIRKAQYMRLKAESDRHAMEVALAARLLDCRQLMDQALMQSNSLKNDIIPAAESAFKQARYGYGIGKFPYLEVLDGQRTLFDTREQYIASLLQYHTSRAELERILATHDEIKFKEIPDVK